jgi:hypothetical protein
MLFTHIAKLQTYPFGVWGCITVLFYTQLTIFFIITTDHDY